MFLKKYWTFFEKHWTFSKKQRYVFFDTFYPIFSGKKRFTNGWVYP